MSSTSTTQGGAAVSFPWCQLEPPISFFVTIYWLILCVWIFNILLGFYGTYKIITLRKNKQKTIFKVLYILASILFIICPAGSAFGFQAGWECWYDFFGWEALTMMGVDAYLYGLAVVYLFFLLRLKYVFEATVYKLNKITLSILLLGLLIMLITPIVCTYYFLSGWNPYDRTWGLRWFTVFTWTNIICSTFVLILFIKKIFKMSHKSLAASIEAKTSMSSMNSKSLSSPSSKTSISMQKKHIDQEMLSIAMRYMVCAIFAMSSTNIVAIFGIIRGEVEEFHSDIRWRGLAIFLHSFDAIINLICLYLQFPFGKNIYGKCCYCINICFKKIFIKILNINVIYSHKGISNEVPTNTSGNGNSAASTTNASGTGGNSPRTTTMTTRDTITEVEIR